MPPAVFRKPATNMQRANDARSRQLMKETRGEAGEKRPVRPHAVIQGVFRGRFEGHGRPGMVLELSLIHI